MQLVKCFWKHQSWGSIATVEYCLSSNPSGFLRLCTLYCMLDLCSWCQLVRLVAWRVVMARKVVSGILCRLARAAYSFCQAMVPFDLGLLPSTQGGEVLQYLGSLACAGCMHLPTWALILVCRRVLGTLLRVPEAKEL